MEGAVACIDTQIIYDVVAHARGHKVAAISRKQVYDGRSTQVPGVCNKAVTAVGFGKADGSVVLPAAIQTGDGGKHAIRRSVDSVLVAEILDQTGAEIGRLRRTAVGRRKLRAATHIQLNGMGHLEAQAQATARRVARGTVQYFVSFPVCTQVEAGCDRPDIFHFAADGVRVIAEGIGSRGITSNSRINVEGGEADFVATALQPSDGEAVL